MAEQDTLNVKVVGSTPTWPTFYCSLPTYVPDKPYEFLEHTADIAVRIYGKNLTEIFVNAARAMFEVLAKRREGAHGPRIAVGISLTDNNQEELLIRWLNELLFLYAAKELVFSDYQIHRLSIDGLEATVTGEPTANYSIHTEIKAATYHELNIVRTPEGLQVEIIFDV